MSTESSHPAPAPSPSRPLTTRVVACEGGGRTRIEERPRPVAGRGELLLRLRSAGLCGTDLFKLAHDTAPAGAVLGHEIVGEVEGVGEGVLGFAARDRVVVPHHVSCGVCPLCLRGSETLCPVFRENLMAPGGFSEHVLVRERAVRLAARKLPPTLSDETAIFLEPAACVLRGVRKAELPPPEAGPSLAVVLGAGSMGLLHLLVLRAATPHVSVVVSDTLAERLALARALGADAALTPDAIAGDVRLRTDSLGADAVFDTVGGSGLLESALALTREGGTVVLFAHAPGGDRARFDLNHFFKIERRVVGTYSGGLAEQTEVWRLICSGRLDASPLVTHRLALSRFEEAVELSRKLRALKVILLPDSGVRP
jgi:L-iditol 2-dehydrogenase